MIISSFFIIARIWFTVTFRFALPAIGQKHCRTARLERFALLCVSSCSVIAFIRHRRRQCPSHHTPIDIKFAIVCLYILCYFLTKVNCLNKNKLSGGNDYPQKNSLNGVAVQAVLCSDYNPSSAPMELKKSMISSKKFLKISIIF